MGSVMDYVACPQCGGTMFTDHYYKSGEEYWMCKRCGKHGKVELIRDEEGKVVLDEKGKLQYMEEDVKGYGCAKIAVTGRGASLSFLGLPITKDDKKQFFELLERDEVDKSQSYLSSWNDETQKVEMIYGEDPKLFGAEEDT